MEDIKNNDLQAIGNENLEKASGGAIEEDPAPKKHAGKRFSEIFSAQKEGLKNFKNFGHKIADRFKKPASE